MSKLRPPQTVSKTKAPSKSAISKQPSVIPSKTQSKKDTAIGDKAPPKKGAKKTEWALPPLSILPKKPKQGRYIVQYYACLYFERCFLIPVINL